MNPILLMDKSGLKAERLRRNFYSFVKEAYPHIEVGEFKDGWHIQLLAEALQLLMEDKIPENKLYINVPPTHMKSLLCLLLIAWTWTRTPEKSFFYISYALELAADQTDKLRKFLYSDWYQSLFKVPMDENSNSKSNFKNKKGGEVIASGIGGQITGKHVSGAIIMDDLIKRDDSDSDAKINEVNSFFDDTIPSRHSDAKTGKEIIVCQRLNARDVIGHIKSQKLDWLGIVLPAFYEGQQYSIPGHPELNDPRHDEELLWPEKYGLPEYMRYKKQNTVLGFSGQYQQRPSELTGAIFKQSYFANRVINTEILARIISVDSSFGKNDFTSIVVGELRNDFTLHIREVYRARLSFAELVDKIEEYATKYQYNLKKIIIESKASGISAIQSLQEQSVILHQLEWDFGIYQNSLVWPITPTKNKIERAMLVQKWCEKELVSLPPADESNTDWLFDFETELMAFPNGGYDDSVDAFTQLLSYLSKHLEQALAIRLSQ